jgi:hypothetical protein
MKNAKRLDTGARVTDEGPAVAGSSFDDALETCERPLQRLFANIGKEKI